MSRWVGDKASEIIGQRGENALRWLERVDGVVENFARERGYTLVEVMEGGTVNAVVRAFSADGEEIVIKAAMSERAVRDEVKFLRELGRDMAPRVLSYEGFCVAMEYVDGLGEYTMELGAEALARLSSRTMVLDGSTYMNADITGQYDRAIDRLGSGERARVDEYARVWEIVGGVIEEALWERRCVVHGDLWRSNILVGEGGAKFIDPSPRMAAKGYDIGYWASDPSDAGTVGARLGLACQLAGVNFVEGLAFAAHFAGHHLGWWERYRGGEDLEAARVRFDETMLLTREVFLGH